MFLETLTVTGLVYILNVHCRIHKSELYHLDLHLILSIVTYLYNHEFKHPDTNIKVLLLLHRALRRITLIVNQQTHLHKISH